MLGGVIAAGKVEDRIAAVRARLDEVLIGTSELQIDFEGTRWV